MKDKVVLAYSGGLDTSVAIKWLQERYNLDVITLSVDVGQGDNLEMVRRKALTIGAVDAVVIDAKEMFTKYFVFPSLQAGALYEGKYPLATALSRPLIAQLLVQQAHDVGARYISHGCTGKGNDQVRLDVTINTLDSDLRIIAPAREWGMNRLQEIEYARQKGIDVPASVDSPYSIDQNLWGRSIEGGILENLDNEPPAELFTWTRNPNECPESPQYLTITFSSGIPKAIDGNEMGPVELVSHLNQVGGLHGIGRIELVENRIVGIKTREIYEAPAAVILHAAHRALEEITLSKDSARFKEFVSREYAELIYAGKWFSYFHLDLLAYLRNNQRFVTGDVKVKLYRGNVTIAARASQHSLYSVSLATYGEGDAFDHQAGAAFAKVFGLAQVTQAQRQLPKLILVKMLTERVDSEAQDGDIGMGE